MKLQKKQLVDSYIDWLKETITSREIGDAIEITSPLMDRHNDFLQIYAVPNGNHIRLTDDAYTINDLLMSGCDVDSTKKRKEILNFILSGYGVAKSETNELFIDATLETFPQKKHLLIQAMLTVNDMFLTTRETVSNIFLEDVEFFLNANDIRCTERINFTGKSGFVQTFDFVIPRSKSKGERLIKALSNPTKVNSENAMFAWDDIKSSRRVDAVLYAFLNDEIRTVNPEIISAFHRYDVKTILWTERENYIPELSA